MTKTVYRLHPTTLEPSRLARFQLTSEGHLSAEWFDPIFEDEMLSMGIYTLQTGVVKFSQTKGAVFFEALDVAFANSSRMKVETE